MATISLVPVDRIVRTQILRKLANFVHLHIALRAWRPLLM